MPRSYLEPFEYKKRPPSYLAGPDVQDYQTTYNAPGQRQNLNLLAQEKQPAVTTPAAQQSWWAKLGKGGQSALMRSALVAGSAMLERTDPEARSPVTAAAYGTLKGLEAHDVIKEVQRKEALKSRLAEIGVDQPSAAYAGQVGRTLAGAGDVEGAISAFEAQSRLAPTPPTAPGLRTVSPGQAIYDPATGRVVTPVEKPPAPTRVFNVGGRLYRYDETIQKAIPLTDEEAKQFTLTPGAVRYERTPEGEIKEIRREKPKKPKPVDVEVRESKLINTIEGIVSKRFGRPPVEYSGFGIRDPDYESKKRQWDDQTEALRRQLMIQYGLAKPEDFEPKPEDIYGPPVPREAPARKTREGALKLDASYIKTMQEYNPGATEEEIRQDYQDRYGVK